MKSVEEIEKAQKFFPISFQSEGGPHSHYVHPLLPLESYLEIRKDCKPLSRRTNSPVLKTSKMDVHCRKERRKEGNLYCVNKWESIGANLKMSGQPTGDKSKPVSAGLEFHVNKDTISHVKFCLCSHKTIAASLSLVLIACKSSSIEFYLVF